MKQFQFSFRENKTLEAELRKLRRWVKSTLCSHVTVRIFTEIVVRERVRAPASPIASGSSAFVKSSAGCCRRLSMWAVLPTGIY